MNFNVIIIIKHRIVLNRPIQAENTEKDSINGRWIGRQAVMAVVVKKGKSLLHSPGKEHYWGWRTDDCLLHWLLCRHTLALQFYFFPLHYACLPVVVHYSSSLSHSSSHRQTDCLILDQVSTSNNNQVRLLLLLLKWRDLVSGRGGRELKLLSIAAGLVNVTAVVAVAVVEIIIST